MATVKLELVTRRARQDGTYAVVFSIVYKRFRKIINTGITATPAQWKDGNIVPTKHAGGKKVQHQLKTRLLEIENALMLAELANEPPAQALARLDVKQGVLFFDFMQSIIAAQRASGRVGNALAYASTLQQLQRTMPNVPLASVDYNYMNEFKNIKTTHGNANNTLRFYMRTVRAVINEAIKRGLFNMANYPFKPGLMPKQEATRKRWLPFYSILTLEAAQLSGVQALARDVYLLGFYLRGCDVVDVCHLTKTNAVGNRVVYSRQKSGQNLSIKITPKARAILEKYKGQHPVFLLPVLAVPMVQDAKNYKTRTQRINRALIAIGKSLGVDEKLTTKTNRHTWATRAKQLGVPRDVIAECLGHSARGITDIYLDHFEDGVLDTANDLVIGNTLCHVNR